MKKFLVGAIIASTCFASCTKTIDMSAKMNVENITADSALVKVTAAAIGVDEVSTWGIAYAKNSEPTTSNMHFESSKKSRSVAFEQVLSNLDDTSIYYVRVYMREDGITYYSESYSFKTDTVYQIPNQVGDIGPGGGIVFYSDGLGGGMEMIDFNVSGSWECNGFNLNSCTSASGTGASNTQTILNTCPSSTSAPAVCNNFSSDGTYDWYLPSHGDLVLIRENLYLAGLGGLSNSIYISSTQSSSGTNYCSGIYMSNGAFYNAPKTTSYRYCAVRTI